MNSHSPRVVNHQSNLYAWDLIGRPKSKSLVLPIMPKAGAPFNDIPDELLETLLIQACSLDGDGRISRRLCQVCHRWHRLVSPILYHNLAVLPPGKFPDSDRFSRLLQVLEASKEHINIQSLILRILPDDAHLICKPLADLSHNTLRTLTLWSRSFEAGLPSFIHTTSWPFLSQLNLVGSIDPETFNMASPLVVDCTLPSLKDVHIIGVSRLPFFGAASNVPNLRTFRVSLVRYYPEYGYMLWFLYQVLNRRAQDSTDWAHSVRIWEIAHQPEDEAKTLDLGSPEKLNRYLGDLQRNAQFIHNILGGMVNPPVVKLTPMVGVPEEMWNMLLGSCESWDSVLNMFRESFVAEDQT
ncbi:hypothetical protein DL96DRAFT_542369 [Flagelloscypha sp. PMI_526]|nr:hypothetical protein DL96DRAFT_542369 [Flagelloscypha sp. PMI_526]